MPCRDAASTGRSARHGDASVCGNARSYAHATHVGERREPRRRRRSRRRGSRLAPSSAASAARTSRVQQRRAAADVDRANGEHRRLARGDVAADREHEHDEADERASAATGRGAPSSGTPRRRAGAPRRERSSCAARPRGSVRRGAAVPYSGGSSSGPRNRTSCSSSTPNRSCTRRRASAISASASARRRAARVLDEVRVARRDRARRRCGGPSARTPRSAARARARRPGS